MKIICLSWNLARSLFRIYSHSLFQTKVNFWGIFGPKNENCLFKLKLGIETNSNALNSVVMLSASILDQKLHLEANLVQQFAFFCLSLNLVPDLD